MTEPNLQLEVDRTAFGRTRLVEAPRPELAPGQVRFRIERFAVTANNITYAVFGDVLGYWDFFPTEAGWGRVPAMGWGAVEASAHPEVPVGGRYYGWFPMSRCIDMTVSATPDGLRDDGAHRAAHAPPYRSYVATDRDPYYEAGADREDRHALLRGLFITAFLADDFFAEASYYGASRVVVLSASSKTAIGFAQRASLRGLDEVVGVTSSGNREFVEQLGYYDRVVSYDEIEAIPADTAAVSIDMAGNGAAVERVHRHLGDQLRYSMTVGKSHHDAPNAAALPGPQPQLFFAPTQVGKRISDWGAEVYRERTVAALHAFVAASSGWLEVTRASGPKAAAATWDAVHAGKVPPMVGCIASLWDRAETG